MARIGTGTRVGSVFAWISFSIGGFLYLLLCALGVLGIAAVIYALL